MAGEEVRACPVCGGRPCQFDHDQRSPDAIQAALMAAGGDWKVVQAGKVHPVRPAPTRTR